MIQYKNTSTHCPLGRKDHGVKNLVPFLTTYFIMFYIRQGEDHTMSSLLPLTNVKVNFIFYHL